MPGTGRKARLFPGPEAPHDQHDAQTADPSRRRRRRLTAHDGPVQLTPSGVMPRAGSDGGLVGISSRASSLSFGGNREVLDSGRWAPACPVPPMGSCQVARPCRGGSRGGASWLCCRLVSAWTAAVRRLRPAEGVVMARRRKRAGVQPLPVSAGMRSARRNLRAGSGSSWAQGFVLVRVRRGPGVMARTRFRRRNRRRRPPPPGPVRATCGSSRSGRRSSRW